MPGMRTPSRFHASSRPGGHARRGSALLYVIASIVLLGVVGGGVAYFSSSSNISNVSKMAHNQAYYAAVAGLQYATKADLESIENSTVTYMLDDNVIIKMTVGAEAASGYPVTICGTSSYGTGMEANYQLPTITVPSGGYDITMPGDEATPAGVYSSQGPEVASKNVEIVEPGHEDYEGVSYIRLGNSTAEGGGCLWFSGSKTVQGDATYCRNGVCKFGKGFRLYFEFRVVSAGADGFTLSFVNAQNNTINDCGGDTSMGELLAYGGAGVSGHGLRPSKIALEVDTFQNGDGYCSLSGSRDDDDDGHVAYVYWGKIHGDFFGYGCKTYDDNIHDVGGGTNGRYDIDGNYYQSSPLRNTVNLDNVKYKTGSNITYKSFANLEDGSLHTIRVEVSRATNQNQSGSYVIKTWVDCKVNGVPCEGLSNLREDLTSKSPDLKTSFVMDKYFHALLSTFLFGFTESTGASAQEVRLTNFKLRFRE